MRPRRYVGFLAGFAVFFAAVTGAVAAQGSKVGETQMCIDTRDIRKTPVIDRRTILVEMRGKGYKRIDLLAGGSGLDQSTGFGFSTSLNKLCVQDGLQVLEAGGARCMIDKIVTIDDDEARALKARR